MPNEKKTEETWNKLVEKYRKEYPKQMAKIDISDLTDLALQVNEENINNYEFLKQFCPEETKDFIRKKGRICSLHTTLDQLANSILARCLINKHEEEWRKKGENQHRMNVKNINHLANMAFKCYEMREEAEMTKFDYNHVKNLKIDILEAKVGKTEEEIKAERHKEKLIENIKKLEVKENWIINKLNAKIAELEQAKSQIENQLTNEKTAAIQKLEAEKNREINELNAEHQKTLANLEKENQKKTNKLETATKQKEQELNSKIAELEKIKEKIRQQVLQERQELENKLRNKVNGKLEKGGIFKPGEQGKDLEEATDNLLEKQGKLENQIYNLEKDIWQISQQLKEEKEKHANEKLQLKARIDKVLGDKNLFFGKNSDNLEQAIDEIFGKHHKHIRSNGEKCLSVVTAPFKWTADKIGTGLALAGFMTVGPAILVGLGWALKAFLAVKTGGVAGAAMVANGMINHGAANNNNLPPNYQPLPAQQNNYSPPAENTPNLPPVINNHYHNLPAGKQENNQRKRKKKRTDNF